MQKTIINYHIEEEVIKSPYLDMYYNIIIL